MVSLARGDKRKIIREAILIVKRENQLGKIMDVPYLPVKKWIKDNYDFTFSDSQFYESRKSLHLEFAKSTAKARDARAAKRKHMATAAHDSVHSVHNNHVKNDDFTRFFGLITSAKSFVAECGDKDLAVRLIQELVQ